MVDDDNAVPGTHFFRADARADGGGAATAAGMASGPRPAANRMDERSDFFQGSL